MKYEDVKPGMFLKFEDDEESFIILVTRLYSTNGCGIERKDGNIHTFDGLVVSVTLKTIGTWDAEYAVGDLADRCEETAFTEVSNPFIPQPSQYTKTINKEFRVGDSALFSQETPSGAEYYIVRVTEIGKAPNIFHGVVTGSNIDEVGYRVDDMVFDCAERFFTKVA